MMKKASGLGVLIAALVLGNAASAHEFMVKPAASTAKAGERFDIAALSGHVFMKSEELEVEKDVRVGTFLGGKRAELPIKTNQSALVFETAGPAPSDATFIVYGTRLPQVWATTPDGVRPATKRTPGASNAFKMEKFSKAIVNAKSGDNGFAAVIGDPLEIVLLSNPSEAKAGEEVTVKVLYKGQPLATNVYATYDGFSNEENTYAYFTEGKSDGTAKVKITTPGLWMVRVQHAAPERTDDYDRAIARSVLIFEIK